MVSLKEHDFYEIVTINLVTKCQKIIGSRLVFKQEPDRMLKARVAV